MKVGPMLGVLVRREYPSTVVLRNPNGAPTKRRRIAKNWDDYYEKNLLKKTRLQRVKDEFWRIYEMKLEERQEQEQEHEQEVDIMQEADRILDNYAAKAVKTMMYHARLDAVKRYYKKHKGEKIANAIARPIQLEFEQYNLVKPANFSTTEGWRLLSQYWCSAEYKKNREAGQAARLKSQDVAQNRGGSRPFAEFQQYLGAKYGEDKAGAINTYSCMKVGQKNISSSGTCGPINSQKAQKRIDDYCQAAQVEYPDDWQQRPLDGKIVYNTTGGLPHGRLAIGHGALKKADVIAAAKGSNIRPSNSLAHQNVLRENQQLVQRNTVIAQRYETETIANREMLLALYEKFQMEVPLGVTPLTGLCHLQEQATGSSRVDSQSSDRTPSTDDADPTPTTDDADEE